MDAQTRDFVQRRAGNRCEYCRIPQAVNAFFTFHVEHIVAVQHQGTDDTENLAFACHRCNAYKGTNLSSVDPETAQIVALFHPRREEWRDHFEQAGGVVRGLTSTGRATVRLLNMNAPHRVESRASSL